MCLFPVQTDCSSSGAESCTGWAGSQRYTYVFLLENWHNQAIHVSCQDASWFQMPWVIAGKICFCVCIRWHLSGWSPLKSAAFHWNVDEIGIDPEDESWSMEDIRTGALQFIWLRKCAWHMSVMLGCRIWDECWDSLLSLGIAAGSGLQCWAEGLDWSAEFY